MKASPSREDTYSATSTSIRVSDESTKLDQREMFCSRTSKLSDDDFNKTHDKNHAVDAGKRVEKHVVNSPNVTHSDDLETSSPADQSIEEDADAAIERKSTRVPSASAESGAKTISSDEGKQNMERKTETTSQLSGKVPSQVGYPDNDAVVVFNMKQNISADDEKTNSEITRGAGGKVKAAVKELPKKRTRKKWKKPAGKPNRPLSAYNLYFRKERAIMLGDAAEKPEQEQGKKRVHRKTHGKIGFAEMAKIIGAKWKILPQEEREEFVKIAVIEKEKYAKDLAQWREEQKKLTIMNGMEAGRKNKDSNGNGSGRAYADSDDLVQSIAEDREKLLRQHQAFRMQMMQDMHVGHLSRLPGEGHGRQMPTLDYLKSMEHDRSSLYFGRSRDGTPSSVFSHYPSAAEGSGRDLYQQMVAMTSGSEGQGRDCDHLRQLKMAHMHLMNGSRGDRPSGSSMGGRFGVMGGTMEITNNQMEATMDSPMGNSMGENDIFNRMGNNCMGSTMGMVPVNNGASPLPNLRHQPHYEMERYPHIPYQNQMPGIHNNQTNSPHMEGDILSHEGSEMVPRGYRQQSGYS
mmetsp:Transcript_27979/g.65789  ORF Transcript_27979/g.65789 Transcript_27979/m.65789 type:complete len:575 (-) Transcript_27979:256-1980(-)|eukprot:CAMPEP_0197185336 /NCGR_PEP_ID=MMETSP1423-20130617/11728_1 /TAXON_ID=476441 /ORGANISM="Pseudo-nitzschia heimii, Strain UNC1101" /LENGTH=574 /DNA_ID=CAMNT_0042636371 /DNA_START=116 /DNA_END=1840 /DNA_ORIENTATION=+